MLENLSTKFNDLLGNVFGKGGFTNPHTSSSVSYRYPLGDVEKFENVIKFTALARSKKSGVADVRVPQLTKSALGSVVLYMPSGLAVNDYLSYDNVDTGLGGMLTNAAGSSASPGEFIDKLKGSAKPIVQTAVSQKLADFSQEKGIVGGAAAQALINIGEVVNPHTQMLFKAPSLRQFSYTFKLMPRSLAEANQIINIVKFFRAAAYPELSSGQTDAQGKSVEMSTYKFPDIFQITYLTRGKENKNLIKQVESYLTAVSVTYNETSPTFYANGMPSEVTLQLTFQESKTLNRNMVWKEGY
jgi:hypothetical protein